ncbi:MAG: hypothetical protein RL398_1005 [Planctomycetota bacterium]
MPLRTLLAWWLLVGAVVGQAAESRPDAAAPTKPLKIHVIGASVSAGFEDGPLFGGEKQGDSVSLQVILRPWCDEHANVTMHPPLDMTGMFRDPLVVGERQVSIAKKRKPDLVVAIDFPFWFAYGYVGDQELQERADRLQKGLEMLAGLEVHVVLGDLPDMTGAARRMLNPRQIPSPKVLESLSKQLREFVAKQERMHLVPLAALVAELKSAELRLPLRDGPLPVTPELMLQGDRLHATRLGMAYLGLRLQGALAELMPADGALRKRDWGLEEFIAAAGAEPDLEAARAAAKDRAAKASADKAAAGEAGRKQGGGDDGR